MNLNNSYPLLPKTLVIAFGHKARQGKDACARHLIRTFNDVSDIRSYAFADALKAHCRVAYGMTEKDGPLLQRIGTDVKRQTDPDIWIRALYWTLHEQQPEVALITDMRFPNEAAFVKQLRGYTVRVNRTNRDGTPYIAPDRDPRHISETALDLHTYDFTINAVSGNRTDLLYQAIDIYMDATSLSLQRHATAV